VSEWAPEKFIKWGADIGESTAQNRALYPFCPLPLQASIEEIDYTTNRGLDKNQLLRLCDCSVIDKKEICSSPVPLVQEKVIWLQL
jgi:hypothetical protein